MTLVIDRCALLARARIWDPKTNRANHFSFSSRPFSNFSRKLKNVGFGNYLWANNGPNNARRFTAISPAPSRAHATGFRPWRGHKWIMDRHEWPRSFSKKDWGSSACLTTRKPRKDVIDAVNDAKGSSRPQECLSLSGIRDSQKKKGKKVWEISNCKYFTAVEKGGFILY